MDYLNSLKVSTDKMYIIYILVQNSFELTLHCINLSDNILTKR